MRRGRGTIRGVALLGLVAVLAQAAVALPAAASDIPGGLEWPGRTPVTVTFGDNVSSAWDSYLRGGANNWGKSSVINTRVVGGKAGSSLCDPDKGGFNRGRAEVCNGRYGTRGWLGLAYVYAERGSGNIVAARVFINDTYFDGGRYDDNRAKRHTMTHELGHALGLRHASGRSVMNDSGTAIFRYDDPTSADYRRLRDKYAGGGRASTVEAETEGDGTITATDVGGGIDLFVIETPAN